MYCRITDGDNEKTEGVFAYSKPLSGSKARLFSPGYELDGSVIANRGKYKNDLKDGYWEHYFIDENYGRKRDNSSP